MGSGSSLLYTLIFFSFSFLPPELTFYGTTEDEGEAGKKKKEKKTHTSLY